MTVAASLLSGLGSIGAFAQTATPPPATQVPATQVPATQVPATQVPATQVPAPAPAATVDAAALESWRASMVRVPLPKNGCFNAAYPSMEWQEVQCGRPSPFLNQGKTGPKTGLNLIDGLSDNVAKTTAGHISSATGSFLAGSSTSGVNADVAFTATSAPNIFMFQINTQNPEFSMQDHAAFNTPACNGAPNGAAGCSGWQQFLFSQTQGPAPTGTQTSAAPGVTRSAIPYGNGLSTPGGESTPGILIEYWVANWGTPCPPLPGWALPAGFPPTTTWISDGQGDCAFNSPMTYVPPQTAADLPNLILTATAGATQDTVVLSKTGGTIIASVGWPSTLSLSQAWTEAEFNVFGDCCSNQVSFTTPTVLFVKTSIIDGSKAPPTCVPNDGTTGESNNLNFEPTANPVCCPYGGASPAIEFMEADSNTHNAWCGLLTRVEGDPHLTTADGTHYDFQGAGEFVTLRDPSGMEIQTRQTPIATTFFPAPNAYDGLATCVSINTAVAARVGDHRVTWEPNLSGVPDPTGLQLRIDGVLTTLSAQGLALGAGGRVAPASGGALEVDFPDGKTLLVTPEWWQSQSKWYLNVDISHLGLVSDASPAFGRGIAGSIATGSWLPALPNGASIGPMPTTLPARYDALYTTFADAWRVTDKTSLFDYAPGTSTATFTMRDWPKQKPPCVVPNTKPEEPISQAAAAAVCKRVSDENRRADCVFDVQVTGNLGFAKNYLNTQRNLALSTTTSLTGGEEPSQPGEWVAFTAFVAPYATSATGVPSGAVQFAIDGTNVAEPRMIDAKGGATFETSRLKVGTHQVTATYVPGTDSAFLPSTSLEKQHLVRRCPCGAEQDKK